MRCTSGKILVVGFPGLKNKGDAPLKNLAKLSLLIVGVLLITGPSVFADTVSIDGTYAFANNGYGIPPYGGTLNGQAAEFYCVDFSHDITGGDTWNAAALSLTAPSSSFGSTYLGSQTDYLEFAYIITQMEMPGTSQATQAEDQWAIWSLSGGTDPYGTGPLDPIGASAILAAAYAAVSGPDPTFTGQGWEILTPDGSNNADGDTGQEFLVQTPEPSALLLLGMGLCGLFLLKRREGFAFSRSAARIES
jgi:hypothetical protein